MMLVLFILIHLSGHVPTTSTEVSCLIINLDFVKCTWNEKAIPGVNYTFQSWFGDKSKSECSTYLIEEGWVVGCRQPYQETERFNSFHTNLIYGDNITEKELDLKSSVKMNPPMNLTVNNDSGHELWLYWNNSRNHDCMESEVRHRTNNNEWTHVMFDRGLHDFSLPLPSQKRRYEFQVRTRVSEMCHMSKFWSEWSQPISWGPFIAPDLVTRVSRTSVWTPVLSVGGFLILLLLLLLLLHNERLRVILIPIVPTPAKNLAELLETHNGNVEEWLHISKELKEGFKPNFSERACSVREYTSQSESSAFITIDQ